MEENPRNPSQWRFTWEAQSHSPHLRLFLFDSRTNPRLYCKSLSVSLVLAQSQLLVTWVDDGDDRDEAKERSEVSLRVPVPRVLIDAESPVNFRALDDHIEVKLVLLLPVDHPVVSGCDSVLRSLGDKQCSTSDFAAPLVMDYDVKTLSSMGEVHFYCKRCSTRLTREGLRNFSEMLSANWREAADNWFGNCCCTFGGISEKLVAKYANSYSCSSGLCLLSATIVLLSKDDLEECILSKLNGIQEDLESSLALSEDLGEDERDRRNQGNSVCHENQCGSTHDIVCGLVDDTKPTENADHGETGHCRIHSEDKASMPSCCVHGSNDSNGSSQLEQTITNAIQLAPDKKFLLDGFLEDVFMARASNVSRNVKWVELGCSKCSSLLGVYPSSSNNTLIDGGVRLFKCYISTSSTIGGSTDAFRKYTLERMFTNQLVEYAKDELSFQVVVKDLTTKSPLFQIVILNPNSWRSTGLCSSEDGTIEPDSGGELCPVVKVLFSDCGSSPDSENRVLAKKNTADEVFILKRQGEKLIDLLTTSNKFLPPSCAYLQGSPISSMQR